MDKHEGREVGSAETGRNGEETCGSKEEQDEKENRRGEGSDR